MQPADGEGIKNVQARPGSDSSLVGDTVMIELDISSEASSRTAFRHRSRRAATRSKPRPTASRKSPAKRQTKTHRTANDAMPRPIVGGSTIADALPAVLPSIGAAITDGSAACATCQTSGGVACGGTRSSDGARRAAGFAGAQRAAMGEKVIGSAKRASIIGSVSEAGVACHECQSRRAGDSAEKPRGAMPKKARRP